MQKKLLLFFLASVCTLSYASQEIAQNHKPRVSIITSVYKGDQFIEGFLQDIVSLIGFQECELILINPNSPGNEEPIIKKYCERYPNIVYERLPEDPGLYAVWNYAIKKARAELITNANLDDRHSPDFLQTHVSALEQDPTVDLIYSNFLITDVPNEPFGQAQYRYIIEVAEFSLKAMEICLPSIQPMWRKSLHDRYGFFDERLSSEGDWEFWLRVVSQGSRFKKIPGISGLYYYNPNGISTNNDPVKAALRNYEHNQLIAQYSYLWKS